jgi:long-chain acyl-CoA synthetase
MSTSIGAVLARGFARYATRPAVVAAGWTKNFAEQQDRVHRVANALTALGARRGDRVVIWLENRPEFLEVEQAVFLAGQVRTALSPLLHPDEVRYIIGDCVPRVVVTTADRATDLLGGEGIGATTLLVVDGEPVRGAAGYAEAVSAASPAPPDGRLPEADDLAALLYTSGTTGRPKAAVLTHANWTAMVTGVLTELPPIGDTDVVLHAAPMAHLSGSVGTACYARGAATALLAQFTPDAVLDAVSALGVTVLPLVPTMLAGLVQAAERGSYDLSSLRAVVYGGSAASPQMLARATEEFGDVLVQVYGLSEALVPLAALSPAGHRIRRAEPLPKRLSSAGRPSPFVDLRIESDDGAHAPDGERGEVLVRGDTVMAGYWGSPAATAEVLTDDGWLRTGDVGYLADGYLHLVDRKRDVIVSGGYNVYPAEVERVIETLPEVRDVIVVGAPHDRWGETVTAVVALQPGRSLTAERVIDVCRAHLASYKKPTAVHFVAALPTNSTGKLLRREVRAGFWAGRDRLVGE